MKLIEWCRKSSIPLSPKNLRISTILISIYQVLLAHVVLFITLLGLAHAEEINTILGIDIADQKEQEEYLDIPHNAKGESINEIRFKLASELASVTLVMLYIGTAIASIYLFSCLGLLIGTLRNRSELMLPWLILDLIGCLCIIAVMITAANGDVMEFVGGRIPYWGFCTCILLFDVMIWFVVRAYYLTLRQMRKLNEEATVPIPCPPPGAIPKIPYYYRKENMYLGDGGYKHLLTDSVEQQNYIV